MKNIPFTRFVPAFCVAFTLGLAPSAAQTTAGTMVPVQNPAATAPAAALSKAVEFGTLAGATAHCPNSTVVWSTLSKSHSFHTSSSRYFGKTKHGAYVCKDDALAAGFHQAKS